MWAFYALLSAFFASLTAIFAKAGVKDVHPDLATAVRTIVVLVLAWGIVFFRTGLSSFSTLSRNSLFFLIFSGLATGLSWIFYFKALHDGPVSKVAPIDKLSVVFTLIFAYIFFKEPVGFKELIGGGLIILGSAIFIL